MRVGEILAKLDDKHIKIGEWVNIKFENGYSSVHISEVAKYMPGTNGWSNYLCDSCGCMIEMGEQPSIGAEGELNCSDCTAYISK